MPLVARVRSKALYTLRAVRRALRILTFWPGTVRGTVSSCDDHQRSAVEASQLERDRRDTQYAVAAWVQAGLAICGAVVICAEPSWTVIRVVAAMWAEQFARDIMSEASQECEIHISKRSGTQETQAARVRSGASVHSAVWRTPHREASIMMPARTCFQRAARCAR
jgi:hypothetical protein